MALVLVLGGGGREHCLAWKLQQSPKVARVLVAPGNAGCVGALERCAVPVAPPFTELAAFCVAEKVDLVVVGPEDPLVNGVADVLQEAGVACFGPSGLASRIEGSKAFSKAFFARHGVPTAGFKTFRKGEEQAAEEYIRGTGPVVVKASGLCAGKGVIVPKDQEEACAAVKSMLGGSFGAAGEEVVVEELLEGPEVSVFCLCDGVRAVPLVPAQDHKRVHDGDEGPNTGGMGAYAPAPCCPPEVLEQIQKEVLTPTMAGFGAEGMPYRGLLYAGLMLTPSGPKLLEYNCRFGDPETQVVLPLLETDLYDLCVQCASGSLEGVTPRFRPGSAVTVVLASKGYPGSYPKGLPIQGLEAEDGATVFHAGTADAEGGVVTSGGRVLAVTALGASLAEAQQNAYRRLATISFDGCFSRTDIAAKAL